MSNNSIIDADNMAREKIISEIKSNFFVEAGAGSGKTTMLVNRMVAMVEEGIPIEKISAITFTKAAAGEFYNRFQKLLIQRSNPNEKWENKGHAGQLPKPTPESMKLCSEALVNIDLCFMGTIDSFCNMVLSEHPSEANIPSDAKLMSDADVDTFIKQKYVDICNGELGDKLKKEAQSFRTFYYDAEDVFVKGIRHFMSHRNVHYNYNHLSDFNVDIDTKLASDREKLLKALKLLLEHPEEISETNQGTRDAKEALKDVFKALDIRWSDNMSNVLYNMKSVKGLRVLHSGYEQFGVTLGDLFQEEHKAKDKSHLINIGEENGT
ncbi:MAG: UvrD-helicase domain-containing protein [Lachnospiraceae bacterium]|nr:UvrD-helicase domain-containing protein [Lachnospiraceae bacterium]